MLGNKAIKKIKIMTTEKLLELLKSEKEKNGETYTDKRKTIEEMLRMKGIKL